MPLHGSLLWITVCVSIVMVYENIIITKNELLYIFFISNIFGKTEKEFKRIVSGSFRCCNLQRKYDWLKYFPHNLFFFPLG